MTARILTGSMTTINPYRSGYDGAYCTVDTFRHLLAEEDALTHLDQVADNLKKGAIYILGLHLLPYTGITSKIVRWRNSRGRLDVHTTMTVLDVNRRRREETLSVSLHVRSGDSTHKFRSVYKLRTYTLQQFRKLIARVNRFEVLSTYDNRYDLEQPITPDNTTEDIVFLLEKND